MSFSRSTSGGQQSLISSLFGKQIEELTCQEALEKLRVISETQYIEFKGKFEDDKGDRDKEVLRAVVGFLNTQDGEGLLALGVNDPSREGERVVCTEWSSKWKDAREVEQHIRDIISTTSHLGSIPRAVFPPLLTVKVFNCRRDCGLDKDGWLILIYVKKSFDALYYSRFEDKTSAYIREGASTRPLTIEEAYKVIESKRKPIVIALLEPSKVGSTNAKFSILLKNIGSKPATQIATMIYIYKKQTIDDQPIEITSVNVKGSDGHYSLYTNKERDRFEVTFFNIHSLGLRTPDLLLFPGPGVKVEEVLETSFSNGFSVFARSGPRKLYFRLYVYTEETKTLEDLEVIMKEREGSKDELNLEGELKHLEVRDYFGNDLLVRDNLDIKSKDFQRLWSPEIDP